MTPEAIEQQLTNFSSFLMEMTGGRMSKTNYTVQAMVSEANDYFESVCDECSDRQELAAYEKTGLTPEQVAAMKQELIDERYRHDRLQDFEVAESQVLDKIKAERDAAVADIQRCCETCTIPLGSLYPHPAVPHILFCSCRKRLRGRCRRSSGREKQPVLHRSCCGSDPRWSASVLWYKRCSK
jgi:hypothetical protein